MLILQWVNKTNDLVLKYSKLWTVQICVLICVNIQFIKTNTLLSTSYYMTNLTIYLPDIYFDRS